MQSSALRIMAPGFALLLAVLAWATVLSSVSVELDDPESILVVAGGLLGTLIVAIGAFTSEPK